MKNKVGSLVIMAVVTLSAFCARASEPPTAPSDQARPTISDLLRRYQEQNPKAVWPQVEERVVHFPKDRSIGHIYLVKKQPAKERNWARGRVPCVAYDGTARAGRYRNVAEEPPEGCPYILEHLMSRR
jgi:hypothetical protein